jgi:plasmid stability protein
MPVTLSVRNVPDALAERLRARAKRNHRSVQGELMALLEDATTGFGNAGLREEGREFRNEKSADQPKQSLNEVAAGVRKLGLPRRSEAVQMIREDRDKR